MSTTLPTASSRSSVSQAGVRPPQRTLGVGDDDGEAAGAQLLVGGLRVRVVESLQRRLEQLPAPAGRTLGDRLELRLRQARHDLVCEPPHKTSAPNDGRAPGRFGDESVK